MSASAECIYISEISPAVIIIIQYTCSLNMCHSLKFATDDQCKFLYANDGLFKSTNDANAEGYGLCKDREQNTISYFTL